MAGRQSSPWVEALPRLTQETELQKMLADEKMRAEQHKTNYQTLKAEHTRLQDEYLQLQNEMKSTIEETKLVQEKYRSILHQTQQELTAKTSECHELQSQVLTPQKVEMVKLAVAEEVEQPFREKFRMLETEAEQYRNEYNKLKYEHTFLKSEYEHDKQEHTRILQELKMRHEAEVENLRKERENFTSRQNMDTSQDANKVRILQRENAQLNLKVKGLLTELEEIREQREHLGLQSDHVTRLQTKQMAEHGSNVKALETEKASLKLQIEGLQRELGGTADLQTELTSRIHDLEKDNILHKNKAEEVSHKSKVELTQLKMDMLKERGDLEREKDRLLNDIEELKTQCDIMKHSVEQQSHALVEKEREAVKRVQAAHEEEWQKLHKVEHDKLEMESRIQELERRRIDDESRLHAERERLDDKLQTATNAREIAEKDSISYRIKVQHLESMTAQLEQTRVENSEVKSRLQRVETEYHSWVSNEQDLASLNNRLKNQFSQVNEELQKVRHQVTSEQQHGDKMLAEHRAAWMEEKVNLHKRIDELDSEVTQLHQNLNQAAVSHKTKKNQYVKLITKLKNRCQLLAVKVDQLELEKETYKKAIPPENHNDLKKQLRDLARKHRDFKTVIFGGSMNQIPIGDLSFASVTGANMDCSRGISLLGNDAGHQKDLEMLRDRLDQLDDNQKQQLEEFKGLVRAISPIPPHTQPTQITIHDLDSSLKDIGNEKDSPGDY